VKIGVSAQIRRPRREICRLVGHATAPAVQRAGGPAGCVGLAVRGLAGKACSIAAINPGAPWEMTSSGEGRPRSLRSCRKSCQASADSPEPRARPVNAG